MLSLKNSNQNYKMYFAERRNYK